MKTCIKCHKEKDVTEYHKSNHNKDGLVNICKSCRSIERKLVWKTDASHREKQTKLHYQWKKNNSEKHDAYIRNYILTTKYGITTEQYNDMFSKQGKVCAICGSANSGYGNTKCMPVDHDHKTGKVRAIICRPCNVTLGEVKDNPDLLRRLADYLEKYK